MNKRTANKRAKQSVLSLGIGFDREFLQHFPLFLLVAFCKLGASFLRFELDAYVSIKFVYLITVYAVILEEFRCDFDYTTLCFYSLFGVWNRPGIRTSQSHNTASFWWHSMLKLRRNLAFSEKYSRFNYSEKYCLWYCYVQIISLNSLSPANIITKLNYRQPHVKYLERSIKFSKPLKSYYVGIHCAHVHFCEMKSGYFDVKCN